MTLAILVAVLTISLAVGDWQSLPSDLATCLDSFNLTAITNGDPSYDDLRLSHNQRISLQPKAIVLPASTNDVANTVQCARASSLKFSVRSGKHSYEGYGVQNDAVLIDLSKMKEVDAIDSGRNEVWLDAGLTLGEVYVALAQFNRTLPGGTCVSVGLGGHVLGGGFGVRSRKYGLMVDRVRAVEFVDVNGVVITADSANHSDLFWALLGAGQGQFGIVTKFRFATVEAKPVINAVYIYPVRDAANALKFLQRFGNDNTQPKELYMSVSLVRSRDSVVITGQYIGTMADFRTAISSSGLEAVGNAASTEITPYTFLESMLWLANLAIDDPSLALSYQYGQDSESAHHWKARSGFIKAIMTDAQISAIVTAFYDRSAPAFAVWDAYVLIDSWGGEIATTPSASLSEFAHRNAINSVQAMVMWADGDRIESSLRKWQDQMWAAFQPSLSGAFVNYADGDIQNYMGEYYPGNEARLVSVKSKYDPENVMAFNQSIPVDGEQMPISSEMRSTSPDDPTIARSSAGGLIYQISIAVMTVLIAVNL